MLVVAALAARAGSTRAAMITATRRWTGSAANAGSRSAWFSRPAIFNFYVLTFDIAEFAETGSKCGQERRIGPGKPAAQKPDHRHRRLLRARRERPRSRATDQ